MKTKDKICISAVFLLTIGNVIQLLYINNYFSLNSKIALVKEELDKQLNKPIYSWEDFDERIDTARGLVDFDKQQYLLNIIKKAHKFHPEQFNDRLADLIINSKDPRIIAFFNKLVSKSVVSGNIDGIIVYTPYIYQYKCPESLLPFFETLAKSTPNWEMWKAFPGFNAGKFVSSDSMANFKNCTVKDYAEALRKTPSDYEKKLHEKK